MLLRYLFDTNILLNLVRSPRGRVAEAITKAGEATVCTSIIASAEQRFGARKSGFTKLAERVDLILSAIQVEPREAPVDCAYAEIHQYLASNGTYEYFSFAASKGHLKSMRWKGTPLLFKAHHGLLGRLVGPGVLLWSVGAVLRVEIFDQNSPGLLS